MTPKNNKTLLLYYIKLCVSFQIHWWIQTGVAVRKCSNGVKISDFFVQRDLEIWWITLKNNRASLQYHIKLCAAFQSHWHIQTGIIVQKRSIRVKIGNFLSWVTNENWRMTLKNNRAPLLYYVKLCASFQIHWWSQTWVTAWKPSSRVRIGDFLSCVTLKIDAWPWKTIGHISYAASTFVHYFITNGEFQLDLQSGNA